MLQDDRTNKQALAGLFDTDMLMSDEFSRSKKNAAPAQQQLQMPTSLVDQMDERHGKFKSRMGLFAHALGGGTAADYGDDDLKSQYKQDKTAYDTQQARGLLAQQFEGIDMNNLSMADVATITQLDAGLGKQALANYNFGQQVGDLGRASEFANDGVQDENDLWAEEIFRRYGRTSDGQASEIDRIAAAAGMSAEQFSGLSTEMQETIMYQHGSEGYKDASDTIGGRKSLSQIEDEAQAGKQGDAIGAIDGSSIEYMHNASSIDFDQSKAMENADSIISMLENDELNTGKWQQWFKDATGVTTRADGTLGAAATENLIKQINSATFGALSEKEIEQLMQTFAQGGQSKEFNLGTMDMVKKKLQTAQEKHGRDTQRAVDRIKDNNSEEYERFMRDDDNYLRYGDGAKRQAITMSGGGEMSYEAFYRDGIANGSTRDEIDVGFNALRKKEQAIAEEQEKAAAQQAELAKQARIELDQLSNANPGSPFGRKK